MRAVHLILLAVFFAGGCSTRLPVEQGAPWVSGETRTRPTVAFVSREEFGRVVESIRPYESAFLRCGLEPGCECRESEEGVERHELAVFLGCTLERGEGGPTFGLDYTYWIDERLGVGPFVDYVAGEIEAFAAGAGVWLRPVRSLEDLAFYVAPGVDIAHEKEEGEHGEQGGRSWEVDPLLRLGAAYGFDLGRGLRLVPSFYCDLIYPDKQAFVLGLTFGKEF